MSPIPRFAPFILLLALAPTGLPVGEAHAQTAQPTLVAPEPGEGIWGLLRRNGITPNAKRVAAFKELNAGRLDGDALKVGVQYRLPVAGSSSTSGSSSASATTSSTRSSEARRYPIFGPEHEWVQRRSTRLAGHFYYIVSGHGGPDPGSIGRLNGRTMPEDEIAYDTALRVARRLLEDGASVYMIVRDSNDGIRNLEYLAPDRDEFYYGDVRMSSNYVRRIRQRGEVINKLYDRNRSRAKSQQVIAVHVDAMAGRNQPQIDVHFAYASDSGRSLGRSLQSSIRNQYRTHQPDRGYKGRLVRRDLYILKHTKPTAVLVELGNIRHQGDQVRLTKPGNRQALAEWIAQGLLEEATRGTAQPRRAQ
ncbi:MAG: N-acetylmuramoyl-L-alanine amidase [Rhodothermales bacterium]|nr:N-acetylmuramoyl-L-alanine amidase [Rhodothermales bacterium]